MIPIAMADREQIIIGLLQMLHDLDLLGARLRQERKRRNQTLEQAARDMGIHASTLRKLKAGLELPGRSVHAYANSIAWLEGFDTAPW